MGIESRESEDFNPKISYKLSNEHVPFDKWVEFPEEVKDANFISFVRLAKLIDGNFSLENFGYDLAAQRATYAIGNAATWDLDYLITLDNDEMLSEEVQSLGVILDEEGLDGKFSKIPVKLRRKDILSSGVSKMMLKWTEENLDNLDDETVNLFTNLYAQFRDHAPQVVSDVRLGNLDVPIPDDVTAVTGNEWDYIERYSFSYGYDGELSPDLVTKILVVPRRTNKDTLKSIERLSGIFFRDEEKPLVGEIKFLVETMSSRAESLENTGVDENTLREQVYDLKRYLDIKLLETNVLKRFENWMMQDQSVSSLASGRIASSHDMLREYSSVIELSGLYDYVLATGGNLLIAEDENLENLIDGLINKPEDYIIDKPSDLVTLQSDLEDTLKSLFIN